MQPLSHTRQIALNYHVEEGKAWLAASEDGAHTTELSYAAFEFRLATERLMAEYLIRVQDDVLTLEDWKLLESIKRMERRIYQLEGHQRRISSRFAFTKVMFEMLSVPFDLIEPNLGELSRYWHQCSDLCHVPWTILCQAPDSDVGPAIYGDLCGIRDRLQIYTSQALTWPRLRDPTLVELEERFSQGEVTADDVRDHFRSRGLWARLEKRDGHAEFLGTAVPPGSAAPLDPDAV